MQEVSDVDILDGVDAELREVRAILRQMIQCESLNEAYWTLKGRLESCELNITSKSESELKESRRNRKSSADMPTHLTTGSGSFSSIDEISSRRSGNRFSDPSRGGRPSSPHRGKFSFLNASKSSSNDSLNSKDEPAAVVSKVRTTSSGKGRKSFIGVNPEQLFLDRNRGDESSNVLFAPPEELIASADNMALDSEDNLYIKSMSKESGNDFAFAEKIKIVNPSDQTDKVVHLLLLSEFRMILATKKSITGYYAKYSIPVLDLELFQVSKSSHASFANLGLTFHIPSQAVKDSITIYCRNGQAQTIFEQMYKTSHGIARLYYPHRPTKFKVRDEWKEKAVIPASFDVHFGYRTMCDYLGIDVKQSVVSEIDHCYMYQTTVLDFNKLFNGSKSISPSEMYALCWSLKVTPFWTEIRCKDISISSESMNSLGVLFTPHCCISSLQLVNTKLDSKGMSILSQHLARLVEESAVEGTLVGLKNIDLSSNKFGSDGISHLKNNLRQRGLLLENIYLSGCGISCQGMADLADLMEKYWMHSVVRLDISGNKMGSKGSSSLAKFLQKNLTLEDLSVANNDACMKTLLQALSQNSVLSEETLQRLDLSGNKMDATNATILAFLLSLTNSMVQIDLHNTKLKDPTLQTILEGIISNTSECQFSIDISSNDFDQGLGFAIPGALETLQKEAVTNIKMIDLSKCKMKEDVLKLTCSAIGKIPSLKILILDKIASVLMKGMKTSEDIGMHIASMVDNLPSLTVLSMKGNHLSGLGERLLPLLEGIGRNKSLLFLNVSGNQLTSRCFGVLQKSLARNTTLKYLNVDRNNAKLSCLNKYTGAALSSKSLCGYIPMSDINSVRKFNRNTLETNQIISRLQKHFRSNQEHSSIELLEEELAHTKKYTSRSGPESSLSNKTEDPRGMSLSSTVSSKFGTEYTKLECCPAEKYDSGIPVVLEEMKQFLLENGAQQQVGVFRLGPNKSEVMQVRKQLDEGTFEGCVDINIVALLLKNWFREYPDKILSDLKPDQINECSKSGEKCLQVIETLSEPKKSLFKWLIDMCVSIAEYSETNKMNAKNLAIVFAPNLYPFENLDPVNSLRTSESLTSFMKLAIEEQSKLA